MDVVWYMDHPRPPCAPKTCLLSLPLGHWEHQEESRLLRILSGGHQVTPQLSSVNNNVRSLLGSPDVAPAKEELEVLQEVDIQVPKACKNIYYRPHLPHSPRSSFDENLRLESKAIIIAICEGGLDFLQ